MLKNYLYTFQKDRQGVSTFDDLIVYISCNSLLDNGLEDAIYSKKQSVVFSLKFAWLNNITKNRQLSEFQTLEKINIDLNMKTFSLLLLILQKRLD